MKWSETVSSECRYGGIAARIWGDWEILWERAEADYQGFAEFLATKDGRFCFYEWTYGSCSGCDDWEARDLSDDAIEAEMRRDAMWLSSTAALETWRVLLESTLRKSANTYPWASWADSSLALRINGVREALGMAPLEAQHDD